jgi:hypothetical protein
MKKIILLILIATTISCSIFKKSTKEKSKEESKTETLSKTDSISNVEIEKEIVSTFTEETKTEFFDLSEVTIFEVMNDSGKVKERTTTIKNNIKTNKLAKEEENKLVEIKEKNKNEKNTLFEHKNTNKSFAEKKERKIEKTSFPTWLWLLIIIAGVLFIIVSIWKVKGKFFV